jgi:hypothetical protein
VTLAIGTAVYSVKNEGPDDCGIEEPYEGIPPYAGIPIPIGPIDSKEGARGACGAIGAVGAIGAIACGL